MKHVGFADMQIIQEGAAKMKTALIDVGGGFRDIYGAGVLDRCMDENIHFDLCIGISAGSANTASYLAGQRGRNYLFYTDYMLRRKCMGLRALFSSGSYLNTEYIYGTLSMHDGENPLNCQAMLSNPADYIVVATDADTGEARYFTKDDITDDDYRIFMGSSSIPVISKPTVIGDHRYFDGALSDCIPIEKALSLGCDRIVLILSKPVSQVRSADKDIRLAKLIRRKYPNAANGLANRADTYNRKIATARALAEEGKLLIISPVSTDGVDTLSKDKAKLDALYHIGYNDAAGIQAFLSA